MAERAEDYRHLFGTNDVARNDWLRRLATPVGDKHCRRGHEHKKHAWYDMFTARTWRCGGMVVVTSKEGLL